MPFHLAFDAHYRPDGSRLAWVGFRDWTDPVPAFVGVYDAGPAAGYEPGKFYLRELPLILEALHAFERERIATIVIDGYVTLDAAGRKGLGRHLYEKLRTRVPVIGVAKTYFRNTHAEVLLRGTSKKPLYVTAAGLDARQACEHIRGMAGKYRLPDLLREADRLSRTE